MKEQLKNYCDRYIKLSPAEFEEFYSNFERKSYKKGEYLLNQGETCRYKYFVVSGLLKSFHIRGDGQEQIHQFGIERWFVTSFPGFAQRVPLKTIASYLDITPEYLSNLRSAK